MRQQYVGLGSSADGRSLVWLQSSAAVCLLRVLGVPRHPRLTACHPPRRYHVTRRTVRSPPAGRLLYGSLLWRKSAPLGFDPTSTTTTHPRAFVGQGSWGRRLRLQLHAAWPPTKMCSRTYSLNGLTSNNQTAKSTVPLLARPTKWWNLTILWTFINTTLFRRCIQQQTVHGIRCNWI